ncbi:DinB family protein [Chryseomicrobium palamuruense]|uniref:DinB family protein n=1 Tax=Chryseomicrobium palamuruense TaxID=682973 RepID=A0ABV8UZN1_9BACL
MRTLELLNEAREELVKEFHQFSDEEINQKPDADTWSAKELCEHLWKMEGYVMEQLADEKIEAKGAVYKPVRLTTMRQIKVEAPGMLQPELGDISKDEILNHLFSRRMQLIEQYKKHKSAGRLKDSAKHPVFMRLKVKQWYDYIGYHEKRHTEQLKRIRQQLNS